MSLFLLEALPFQMGKSALGDRVDFRNRLGGLESGVQPYTPVDEVAMMEEMGIPTYTSYIFLGLSLSIGYLVYILVRDSNRKKREKEETEQRRANELLREAIESVKAQQKAKPPEPPVEEGDEESPETEKET